MKSPAFVSRPHFFMADDSYLRQFQYGMRPDPSKHDSTFWLEPESSIPVKVEMRLQLNILLRKVEGIDYLFKNLQEVMYPVFWFEVRQMIFWSEIIIILKYEKIIRCKIVVSF